MLTSKRENTRKIKLINDTQELWYDGVDWIQLVIMLWLSTYYSSGLTKETLELNT
jgi:hypothetical protein